MNVFAEHPVERHRLLLVEDNPADADLVREYLLDIGEAVSDVETAHTLRSALERLEGGGPFAAILLDLNLPDSAGLETLERVLAAGPAVPVIVLTGEGGEDFGARAVAAGAADFLPKDELTGRLLLRSVRYATERSRRRDMQVQYRALVENARDLVSILERDLTIRYVSPSIERVLGYEPAEKEGVNAALEVHPDDQVTVARELGRLLQSPDYVSHLQYRVRHKDGEWRTLDTIAQNCFDDPNIRGLVVSSRDTTELDEARREAAATMRRLGRTLGALQDAVFTVVSEDRTIVDCNAAAESMFGYDAEEMVGRSTRRLHTDRTSYERFAGESEPVLREGGSYRAEYRMRRKNGEVFPVEVTVSLLDPQRGLEAGVVSVVRDITETVERSRQVRFQAALLEQVAQPVLAVDERARVTYWNRAAEELTGFKTEDVLGTEVVDILIIEEDRPVALMARETAAAGDRWKGEIRLRTKDGGVVIAQATAAPAVNPDGSAGGRIAAGIDITELRRTEEESRRAADRLRLQASLLEAVGQAVIATDLGGRIIYWNRAAEDLYGWPREEALGQSVLEITPDQHGDGLASDIFEALRMGGIWTGTVEARRRDGSAFQAMVTDAPLYDDQGALAGVIGVSTDMTERIELEDRLRQAEKMEAIGRLAAGVAHDFNNLLTAVEGHASFLLDELDPESRLREDVEEIRSAGRRAADLTRRLLAFSRKQALQERHLDLVQTTFELETMLRRIVPERIELEVRGAPEPVVVRADPTQLHQIVMNLVVNAVDAIEAGGRVTLAVDDRLVTPKEAADIPWDMEPGRYARLTVADTGSGMSREVLAHIFEPFFTTKPEGHGTGLGLSSVFGIVKQSGGHILVDSGPGQGTTFEVLLPQRPTEHVETGVDAAAAYLRKKTVAVVLLVEDEVAVRRVARRVLTREGCTVLEAANGEEALALVDQHDGAIDVVLSDVVMPDMGGIELQKRLGERYPDIGMVLTSGYSEAEVQGDIRGMGVTFVPKPFTPESLMHGIWEAMNRDPD